MAPVHDAARDNDVEALRALLDADPGLIELQSEEWPHLSPLNIAGGHGHMEAARLLLDRGAQVEHRCPFSICLCLVYRAVSLLYRLLYRALSLLYQSSLP